MPDIPQNLFSIFNEMDNKDAKNVKISEDDVIKITECLNATFISSKDFLNFQNFLSTYASTASILKAKYKKDLSVDEFNYLYNTYVRIMEKAVKEMTKSNNGSKDYVR